MAVIIMISTFGCVNGLTLMGAAACTMRWRATDSSSNRSARSIRNGVPAAGLWLQCAWSIVLIFSGSYNELLDYIIFAALMFYILTVSAVFVLRGKSRRRIGLTGPGVIRCCRACTLFCAAVIMLSLLVVKPVYSWPSFIIVLAGIPVYYLWRSVNRASRAL